MMTDCPSPCCAQGSAALSSAADGKVRQKSRIWQLTSGSLKEGSISLKPPDPNFYFIGEVLELPVFFLLRAEEARKCVYTSHPAWLFTSYTANKAKGKGYYHTC